MDICSTLILACMFFSFILKAFKHKKLLSLLDDIIAWHTLHSRGCLLTPLRHQPSSSPLRGLGLGSMGFFLWAPRLQQLWLLSFASSVPGPVPASCSYCLCLRSVFPFGFSNPLTPALWNPYIKFFLLKQLIWALFSDWTLNSMLLLLLSRFSRVRLCETP